MHLPPLVCAVAERCNSEYQSLPTISSLLESHSLKERKAQNSPIQRNLQCNMKYQIQRNQRNGYKGACHLPALPSECQHESRYEDRSRYPETDNQNHAQESQDPNDHPPLTLRYNLRIGLFVGSFLRCPYFLRYRLHS